MIEEAVMHLLRNNSDLHEPYTMLRTYVERDMDTLPEKFWENLKALKAAAVSEKNQTFAKTIWCLETAGKVQDYFITAFTLCRQDNFYGGWCYFERCEIQLASLDRHFREEDSEFGLNFIREHYPRFQFLFPYRLFISPGFIVKEARCSICDEVIKLRGGCGHIKGEIYDGELCVWKITGADFLEVSLVENPVQKYSVVFPQDGSYNYALIKYVVDGLRSPWHAWDYDRIMIETDEPLYPGVGQNEQCPCGSGNEFRLCCINKRKFREHYQVFFSVPPPKELPNYVPTADYRIPNKRYLPNRNK